ncbi:sulfurtransferase [Microbacterium sp. TNHR37B]|uniref:sulfurtransferase n=1 Tax=Microbacterium sp. TNHR37B TaxID=1775956 RepID=UPI0007B17DF7|nr:sulfurtransferase [Microbacterium sp. TNHR37B]KZE88626.1 putative thiosulfate sulfurtransferase SseB [Microbacterium sp. TNHR37B]
MTALLVTPEELARELDGDRRPVVLDVRWRLDAPDGRAAYEDGHIPSALYVSLDDDLAAHGLPTDGRHPLPDADVFADTVRGWGIDDGDTVVVYDDWMSYGAARAWWMLRDAGIDARVLDGGLAAWRAAGLSLESGPGQVPARGTATLRPGQLPQLSMDDAAAQPGRGLLLDVRAPERYRGEVEPMDPRAGHIPGALNAPTADSIGPDGRLRGAAELRETFAGLVEARGADPSQPIGVYCGSGVSASHAALALTVAGFTPALYAGSWSQWSNHPDRPLATS